MVSSKDENEKVGPVEVRGSRFGVQGNIVCVCYLEMISGKGRRM